MKRHKKKFIGLFVFMFSFQLFAESTLKITVKTNEATSFGIGYLVEGKASGALGKIYSGKGPKNKTYFFGFRTNFIQGENVPCGSLTLTEDTTVTLVMKNKKCFCVTSQ